jgi:hypothetical protein
MPLTHGSNSVENGIMELYKGFFQLRSSGEYQKEYDAMTTLINMLIEDKQFLLKKHGEKINA